jgi:hypothetical protein
MDYVFSGCEKPSFKYDDPFNGRLWDRKLEREEV